MKVPDATGRRARKSAAGVSTLLLFVCLASNTAPDAYAQVTPSREPLDAIPTDILHQMFSARNLVAIPGVVWNAHVLTVAFEDSGSDGLYALIEKTAGEWTSHGGQMRLSFRNANGEFRHWTAQDNAPAAAIRISFRSDPKYRGYWSAIGRLAESLDANQPTLNLEGFPQKVAAYVNGLNASGWRASYEHSVVLHELGHTLGLAHEHFHPECQADLKLDRAIDSLQNSPGWTLEKARLNLDAAFYFKLLASGGSAFNTTARFSPHVDRASVMLYDFSDDLYKSGAASPCKPEDSRGYATTLSAGDIRFYLDSYSHIAGP